MKNIFLKFIILLFIFVFPLGASQKQDNLDITLKLISSISETIHSLQQERGASCGYVSSKGKKFQDKLQKIKKKSDRKIEVLKEVLETKKDILLQYLPKQKFHYFQQELQKVYHARKNVQQLNVTFAQTFSTYTQSISFLLLEISNISDALEDKRLSDILYLYSTLLMYKESIGQERAELSALFAKEKFEKETFEYFLTSVTQEKIYLKSFLHNANKEVKEFYLSIAAGPSFAKVKYYKKLAREKLAKKKVKANAEVWFVSVTKNINQIQKVEYRLMEDVKKTAKIIRKELELKLKKIHFTPQEKAWLEKKEKITYVYDPDWAPFEYINGINIHEGIIADILKLIEKNSGLIFEPIHVKKWSDAVNLAQNYKVDMYSAVLQTPEREAYMNFTQDNIFNYFGSIVSRVEDTHIYKNIAVDLQNKVIGITKANAIGLYMLKHYPKLNYVEVSSTQDGLKKLQNKIIDFFVLNIVSAEYFLKNKDYDNLKIAMKIDNLFGLKIAISKRKNPLVVSILNKVLQNITKEELSVIYKKWIKTSYDITLSEEEKKYIAHQKPIRYVYDPTREPFEYVNELGNHSGVVANILNLIAQKSSLKFEAITTKNWSESVALMEKEEADMFSFVIENEHREDSLDFTDKTLFKVPAVFVTQKDDDTIYENIEFTLKNKKIGIVKGRAIHKKLLKKYPDFHFIELSSVQEGFEKVESGEVDMFALNKSTAKYYIKRKGFSDIKIATTSDVFFEFKIALQKKLPKEVLSLINKSLSSITKQEINTLYNNTVNVEVKKQTDWIFIGKIGIVIVIILIFILYSNRQLHKKVEEKTQDLQNVLDTLEDTIRQRTQELYEKKDFIDTIINSQNNFVITSDGLRIKTANKAFLEFYDVNNVEEFIEKFGICVCDTFDTNAPKEYIQKTMGNQTWLQYINQRPNQVHNVRILKDKKHYIFNVTSQKLQLKGKNFSSAIFTDITQMEVAKKELETIHKHTKDSIEYASLIQGALVPKSGVLQNYFKDNFVTWTPKDTVGGDIWLFDMLRHQDECVLFYIDCTGHGVPGAFVTMIVKAVEREIVSIIKSDATIEVSPAWIMGYFNKTIKRLLRQDSEDSISNAGFDGGIIYYNRREQVLKFSGAETSLFYTTPEGEFHTIKGNHYSVGYKKCDMNYEYKESIINVEEGMKFFCTTDGYLDQNGGEKGFPFGKKRFSNIIKENYQESMGELQNIFMMDMMEYENAIEDNERNDDMTVIGFEIGKKSQYHEVKIEEIVKYEGVMTQNVIATAMDNLDAKITNMSRLGVISTITIEYCQNMMNYSKNKIVGSREIVPAGRIEVTLQNDSLYSVSATNIISKEDKEKVEPKLIEICSLDKAGIKKRYRELRKSGQNTHEKGGGIGLYEIAKVSDSIEYVFEIINEDKYYFTMQSFIKIKNKREEV